MELTKNDSKMTKGLAILFMVMLHLFCKKVNLPYTPLLYIGSTPLIYYFGLFGDCCVAMYCFCSGYAHALLSEKKQKKFYPYIMKKLLQFLCNYWLIIILFSITGLIIGSTEIPGTFSKFIGNVFLYSINYNGAWWFVLTYVILCVFSPILHKIVKKSSVFSLIAFLAIYVISYLVRFHTIGSPLPDTMVFNRLSEILSCLGTSLLPYIVGMIFYKHKIFTFIKKYFSRLKPVIGKLLLLAFVLIMFVGHAIVQSVFVAVFTGMGIIICFNLWEKPKFLAKHFEFFGNQSTNIWLIHMFFYMVLFKNFVFIAKYPLFVLILMLAVTIPISLLINLVLKAMKKTVLKRFV